MKKILVLGWYGTVGSVVVHDLIKSWFFVGIAGRNRQKIDELRVKVGEKMSESHILDFTSEKEVIDAMVDYDLVLNCVEYTLNQMILKSCIKAKKHYVDLGGYYEGILESRSYDKELQDVGIVWLLGAGSSPWIINIMIAHITKNKKNVKEVIISFSDIVHTSDETMLPFNFQTVVEEIVGDALAFEKGAYTFVPGASKSVAVDFGDEFGKAECFVTNHDEQYSIPLFLKEKWIENCYFVMNHNPLYLQLIPAMKELGFFSEEKIKVWGTEISPLEFINTYMKKFLPAWFESDDREILFAQIDDVTVGVINNSVNGTPAGIINTWIWASLIAQYIVTNDIKAGIHHPEDCIDSEWMISELKKRNFEIQVNGKNI